MTKASLIVVLMCLLVNDFCLLRFQFIDYPACYPLDVSVDDGENLLVFQYFSTDDFGVVPDLFD